MRTICTMRTMRSLLVFTLAAVSALAPTTAQLYLNPRPRPRPDPDLNPGPDSDPGPYF